MLTNIKIEVFEKELKQIVGKLQMLLKHVNESMQVFLSNVDVQKSEDILFEIAELFDGVPELKVKWLRKLAEFHEYQSNYAESAQCYLRIISIVLEIIDKKIV
jgi:hypothetical protein